VVLKYVGIEVKCTSSDNAGSMEASKKSGAFDIDFKGCTGDGERCRSEGDAAEVILTEGTWHLVLTTISGVDKHLVWFSVKEFKLECGSIAFTIKGSILGELTPANTKTTSYTLNLRTTSGGQEYTTFENDSGEKVSASLLAEAGLGFNKVTEEVEVNKLTTLAATEIIN
jgi:hypothetical protein